MARIRIGVSGWRYEPWRGVFYPEGLPQRRELWYASRSFSAIEINGSFHSLQRPENYAQWYAETPGEFVFAARDAYCFLAGAGRCPRADAQARTRAGTPVSGASPACET